AARYLSGSKRAAAVASPSPQPDSGGGGGGGGGGGLLLVGVAAAAAAGGGAFYAKSNKEFRETVSSAAPFLRGPLEALADPAPATSPNKKAPKAEAKAKPTPPPKAVAAQAEPAKKAPEPKASPTASPKASPKAAPAAAKKAAPVPAPEPLKKAPSPPVPAPVAVPALPPTTAAAPAAPPAVRAARISSIAQSEEELRVVSAALKKELDETVLKDIEKLDAPALRYRLVQLAAEMKERTKWEALRLSQFLAQAEKANSDRFQGVLQEQRLRFEEVQARGLREQEALLEARSAKAVQAKEAEMAAAFEGHWQARAKEFEEAANVHFEKNLGDTIAAVKKQYADDLAAKAAAIEELGTKVREMEGRIASGGQYEERSGKVHRIVGGVMGLVGAIESGDANIKNDIATLAAICRDDEVLSAALKSVSGSLASASGAIPSLPELQERFNNVKAVGRKMSLVGEGPGSDGLTGLFAGEFFSRVMVPVDDRVAMSKKESELDDEDRLARASYFVRTGKLEQALSEMDSVKAKKVKLVVKDFRDLTAAKVSVDKCVSVLKLRCAALNEGMKS
ncbi:hypothetical protein TeGR_g14026, partial [Tetraparma gracilis]